MQNLGFLRRNHWLLPSLKLEISHTNKELTTLLTFSNQVHQVKKSNKKWSCKLCGEKQSLIKVL